MELQWGWHPRYHCWRVLDNPTARHQATSSPSLLWGEEKHGRWPHQRVGQRAARLGRYQREGIWEPAAREWEWLSQLWVLCSNLRLWLVLPLPLRAELCTESNTGQGGPCFRNSASTPWTSTYTPIFFAVDSSCFSPFLLILAMIHLLLNRHHRKFCVLPLGLPFISQGTSGQMANQLLLTLHNSHFSSFSYSSSSCWADTSSVGLPWKWSLFFFHLQLMSILLWDAHHISLTLNLLTLVTSQLFSLHNANIYTEICALS